MEVGVEKRREELLAKIDSFDLLSTIIAYPELDVKTS
jgi:hypothetical protein